MLLLILFFAALLQARVTPLYSCWFVSYGNASSALLASGTGRVQHKTVHIVWGYENDASSNVVVYPQRHPSADTAVRNIVMPLLYNGQQEQVFKPGTHPYAFVTADAHNQLRGEAKQQITWSLFSRSAGVSLSNLTSSMRCAVRFPTRCPLKIAHFCEDGAFCNGEEACVPNFVHTAVGQERYGSCRVNAQPPVCPQGQLCDERTLGCTAPAVPATAVPVTGAPTQAMRTDALCTTDVDCLPLTTYCLGLSTCQSGTCGYLLGYSPCPPGSICSSAGCFVSPSACVSDDQCHGYEFCRGNTSCINGHCRFNITYQPCDVNETCVNATCVPPAEMQSAAICEPPCGDDAVCAPRGCVLLNETQTCARQSDCANATTYCEGPAQCIDGLCLYSASFDACADAVTSQGRAPHILAALCDNEQQTCFVTYAEGDDMQAADDPTAEPTTAPTASPTVAPPDDQALMIFAIVFGSVALALILIAVVFIIRSQAAKRQVVLNASATNAPSPFAASLQTRRTK